ncbi:hypothetical protein [Flavobacterium sp.]|jgi:hypothetical protein|uniref:hypothetical protein n=1 Tax=Flavobacterium sp. TaxID=239 RepID=UPI0037BEA0DA
MRYIFIFLITSFSFGQSKPKDLTELELLHHYGIMHVSTCDYSNGISDLEVFCCNTDMMIKTSSNNEDVVKNLYKIIFEAKKWEKREIDYKSYFGNGYIENRYIITYNSFQDTIYTSKHNRTIIFKGGLFEYIDKKQEINKALDNELKSFLTFNYIEKKAIVENLKNDSIDVSSVLLNNKNLYKIKSSDFENSFNQFTDYTINNTIPNFPNQQISIEKTYRYFGSEFYFRDEEKLDYFSIKNNFDGDIIEITINNIKCQIGDSLEKYKLLFKNSILKEKESQKLYNTIKYENFDFFIQFKENKGYLLLVFSKNEELVEINVSYN